MARERIHLRITGMVQGVFYRASARQRAEQLGLEGWVRNLADGSVELVAEGDAQTLERIRRWCLDGPPGARVDDVQATKSEATGEFGGFGVHY